MVDSTILSAFLSVGVRLSFSSPTRCSSIVLCGRVCHGDLDPSAGSLERIIAQVDMEENGDSGAGVSRPEHARPPVDGGYPNSRGGSAGSGSGGGGGGGGGGGSSAGGGWTDMFQGMTVEVRGKEEG